MWRLPSAGSKAQGGSRHMQLHAAAVHESADGSGQARTCAVGIRLRRVVRRRLVGPPQLRSKTMTLSITGSRASHTHNPFATTVIGRTVVPGSVCSDGQGPRPVAVYLPACQTSSRGMVTSHGWTLQRTLFDSGAASGTLSSRQHAPYALLLVLFRYSGLGYGASVKYKFSTMSVEPRCR